MNDTFVDIPTVFEIKIREFGWIHSVFVKIDDVCIPCEWVGYTKQNKDSHYSIFRALYTFKNVFNNKKAIFYYCIDDCQHICKPIIFNVCP